MTRLTGSSSADIDAPIDRCWAVVQDLTEAPRWQGGLERVEVLERDAEGRPLICDTLSDAKFTKVRCRVRISYDPPHRLTFTRVESDDVDEMEGSWELEDLPVAVPAPPTGWRSTPVTSASWPGRWSGHCDHCSSGAAPRSWRGRWPPAVGGRGPGGRAAASGRLSAGGGGSGGGPSV